MGKKVIPVVTSETEDGPARPHAVIRIRHQDGRVEEQRLEIGRYEVGRTSGDILLTGDRSVSRLHARLDVTPTEVTLTDLGSTSGTFDARGQRLEQSVILRQNDAFRIGHAELSVVRLVVPNPSGVRAGARLTQPAIPTALQRGMTGVTVPEMPAAKRQARRNSARPSANPASPANTDARAPESEPAISGPRATKQKRSSKKPPP
jgi:pSer/pThr/pTyr-binding forkhead associated (FHA) protein